MRKLRSWVVRLGGLFNKQRKDRELEDEIAGHVQMHIEDNLQSGMTPEEARREAMIKLGGLESTKEAYRDQRGLPMLETLWQDIRYGARMLRKNPGFTAVAVLTLTLGIGANTTIFSVVSSVLLRPLPFKEPGRLVTVWEVNDEGLENVVGTGTFLDWREQNQSFEDMAIFWANIPFFLSGEPESERINGAAISANLFHLLGVTQRLGRPLTKEEETTGRDRVALLSEALWRRRFGADPNIVGRTITLDGRPEPLGSNEMRSYVVVGVMPSKVKFPGKTGVLGPFLNEPPDVWVPLPLDGAASQERRNHSWQVVARLKPGVTLAQATADMDGIQQRLEAQYPGNFLGKRTKLLSLRAQGVANVQLALLTLLGAVSIVLLIACANVANLLLLRAAAREKEMAVRLALGASRWRVVRQLLAESMLLALSGAVLGTLAAEVGNRILLRLTPSNVALSVPGWEEIGIDFRVLGFTLLATFITAILFGSAPAWRAAQTNLHNSLKEGSRGTSAGKARLRLRGTLVEGQVGLTLILLIAASLLIQSYSRLQHIDPGFQSARLLTMRLDLPDSKYPHDHHKAAFFDSLLERIKALPGVESAGMTLTVPFGGGGANFGITVDGRANNASGKPFTTDWRPITPDYFRSMGIPLLMGRVFDEQDQTNAQKVVMINETFARSFLPGEEPLGKRVTGFGDEGDRIIVGVVRDFKQWGLDTAVRTEMYTPQAQTPWGGSRTFVVRATGEPIALTSALRAAVRAMDPELPISNLETMDTLISNSVAHPRFRTFLLTLFAAFALMLAAIGIYGVIAYSVSQRVQEIGIRMALGAQRGDILSLVLREGMKLTALGVVIGLAGAFGLTRVIRTLLFGIGPADPLTFTASTLLLGTAAFLACWFPAHRALKVDPMVALRYE